MLDGWIQEKSIAGSAGTTVAAAISTSVTATTTSVPAITTVSSVTAALRLAGGFFVLFVDPALHANDAVNCAGFSKAVVERHAQGLERHLAFTIAFCTSDISATKATGATEANTLGTEFHGGLQGAFHGAAEADTAFKLHGDLLGHRRTRARGDDEQVAIDGWLGVGRFPGLR